MQLQDLQDKYLGSDIWVIGTGDSLNRLDLSLIDGPRIYIHRAAMRLPVNGDTYWLVLDDAWTERQAGAWDATLDMVKRGEIKGLFKQPFGGRIPLPAIEHANIANFFVGKSETLLQKTKDEISQSSRVFSFSGAGGIACQLAWFMGAKRIKLAGFHGCGWADILLPEYGDRKPAQMQYATQRMTIQAVINALQNRVEFLTMDGEKDENISRQPESNMGDIADNGSDRPDKRKMRDRPARRRKRKSTSDIFADCGYPENDGNATLSD